MGQIRGFFRSDFSAFGAPAPKALKSDLKKPRICLIWGQSDPLWSQTYHPWLLVTSECRGQSVSHPGHYSHRSRLTQHWPQQTDQRHDSRRVRSVSKVGQIFPNGKIRHLFKFDFSAFWLGNVLKSHLKKSRIGLIWGQSSPPLAQIWHLFPWVTKTSQSVRLKWQRVQFTWTKFSWQVLSLSHTYLSNHPPCKCLWQ